MQSKKEHKDRFERQTDEWWDKERNMVNKSKTNKKNLIGVGGTFQSLRKISPSVTRVQINPPDLSRNDSTRFQTETFRIIDSGEDQLDWIGIGRRDGNVSVSFRIRNKPKKRFRGNKRIFNFFSFLEKKTRKSCFEVCHDLLSNQSAHLKRS